MVDGPWTWEERRAPVIVAEQYSFEEGEALSVGLAFPSCIAESRALSLGSLKGHHQSSNASSACADSWTTLSRALSLDLLRDFIKQRIKRAR